MRAPCQAVPASSCRLTARGNAPGRRRFRRCRRAWQSGGGANHDPVAKKRPACVRPAVDEEPPVRVPAACPRAPMTSQVSRGKHAGPLSRSATSSTALSMPRPRTSPNEAGSASGGHAMRRARYSPMLAAFSMRRSPSVTSSTARAHGAGGADVPCACVSKRGKPPLPATASTRARPAPGKPRAGRNRHPAPWRRNHQGSGRRGGANGPAARNVPVRPAPLTISSVRSAARQIRRRFSRTRR